MSIDNPDVMPIAVRIFPEPPANEKREFGPPKRWRRLDAMFVFDTETTTDETQRLTFGSYRMIVRGRCIEEGLVAGDGLSEAEWGILRQYVATHRAETACGGSPELLLLTRGEFADKLFRAAYRMRCLLVGFNLPFDLSRVAFKATNARGRFSGGFSLRLWSYIDETGSEHPDPYRPGLCIKRIDSKRALKGFTARLNPDASDQIPEGSTTGGTEPGYIFRGHLLDLRTLAFSLTDRGYSLETACNEFGVAHPKQRAVRHGVISDEYIDYNRRDVLATAELAEKLLEEYDRHPIMLQVTKAYSPASIGKAYLHALGITPVLERQPDFDRRYLGYAASAFFGGRASAHIRKIPVPVVYTDFLSMYPTVNSLMNLWGFVIAREIRVIDNCQSEITTFLAGLSAADLFNPVTWSKLTAFVRIVPDGDILPTRGKYGTDSNDWQVAHNHLHAGIPEALNDVPAHALWFSLPDVVASVMLTGRVPKIIDAFRLEPVGILPGLKPVSLRGEITVDPETQDFFRVANEERQRLKTKTDLRREETDRLGKALKVTANATGYGIYAEMNRQESDEEINLKCHGIDSEPFTCRVRHPDVPGKYCFPPLASLITGGARLMLALLEKSVTELGGTYAMEDTDSMAIVATETGGMVNCIGGPHRSPEGGDAVLALSWKQVEDISERFCALNPYDRAAIPGSILKIEDDNFVPDTGAQRQLYCLAISTKRYALFFRDKAGDPEIVKWSEHGLGHLLNPTDPECSDRKWIKDVWLTIVRRALGLPCEQSAIAFLPAIGRVGVTSPAVMRPFTAFNAGRVYADQIKPFNFILTCQIKPLGHPTGCDPAHFHLIAPYESHPKKWLRAGWIDQYTGKRFKITTSGYYGTRQSARVKTFADVLTEYEFHPESKCADSADAPCVRNTVGLLRRRHVRISQIKYIGKESNGLEDVESGMVHSAENVYTEYPDPRRDEWQTVILPVLKLMPVGKLVAKTGMSRRALIDLRAGRARPHAKNLVSLTLIAKETRES